MVYIYKKSVGSRNYYYLRASGKRGRRTVTKDLAYLGSSIEEAKKALADLPPHKEEIRRAYKGMQRFLESNHWLEKARSLKLKKDEFLGDWLEEVEACRLHYAQAFGRRDKLTKDQVFKNFAVEFAFNTTSIEGNTISLKQARNLLEEGRTPKNKTLREVYDLQNTEKAFNYVLGYKGELNSEFITGLHAMLMENIDCRTGYRTEDVHVIRASFKSTPAPYVKTDMDLLLKWCRESEGLHPLVLAAMFHHKFEKVHPFMDGNGRVGRMLLDTILIRNGYPPLIIHRKRRAEYLDALGKADKAWLESAKKEDYADMVGFVSSEMAEVYWDLFL